MRVQFSVERVVFKGQKLRREADRANVSALFIIAKFIRTTAKQSMKKPGKKARKAFGAENPPSPRGKPPFKHAGDRFGRGGLLAELMEYDVDKTRLGATIGSKRIRSKTLGKSRPRKPVPNLHEFGGRLSYRTEDGEAGVAKYPPRPYMAPALEKSREKIPSAWDQVFGKGATR